MHYVTSDLHGYPLKDFQKLLDSAGFTEDDDLYVLGDVIDRNGDGGIETLRWMMTQPNITLIMGNHEESMLLCDFLFEDITDDLIDSLDREKLYLLSNWYANGAEPTLKSLRALNAEDPDAFGDLMDYVRYASLYEILKVNGRVYILTHAGLGGFSEDRELEDYTEHELLWTRPAVTDTYFPNATVIFGHTPTVYYGEEYKKKMLRTPTWIDIDTGAAAGWSPMLFRLEDEKEFYAE